MVESPPVVWMVPTLGGFFLWGLAQGFVKKYIQDVSPANYCLYYVAAISVVNLGYYLTQGSPPIFASNASQFALFGILTYTLDGLAWIFYYLSIIHGPITIVGTLSAAYPAITVLLNRLFLNEHLSYIQYVAAAVVIGAVVGLAYDPVPQEEGKPIRLRWIPLAIAALLLWGVVQTVLKYAYTFPGADEARMSIYSILGGAFTLAPYGLWAGRKEKRSSREWIRSAFPMILMAGGSLAVIIATHYGPGAIVATVSGAYPVVTLVFARFVLKEKVTTFQWCCIVAVIAGIAVCTLGSP